jgi:hypothetical protein
MEIISSYQCILRIAPHREMKSSTSTGLLIVSGNSTKFNGPSYDSLSLDKYYIRLSLLSAGKRNPVKRINPDFMQKIPVFID